ncbi:hypothetical protein ACKVWC_011565 [Pyricularia oryzae]
MIHPRGLFVLYCNLYLARPTSVISCRTWKKSKLEGAWLTISPTTSQSLRSTRSLGPRLSTSRLSISRPRSITSIHPSLSTNKNPFDHPVLFALSPR